MSIYSLKLHVNSCWYWQIHNQCFFHSSMCVCVCVCVCVCACVCALHMHQAWQVSWCALQVCRFAWLGPQSPYCTRHPSTRATWSLCQGSMACAAKPRRSTWGEVRRRWEGRNDGGKKTEVEMCFYSVLVYAFEMRWGSKQTNHWQSADSLCPAKLCRMFRISCP